MHLEKLASPTNKMNLIRLLNALHKVKRFGKAKSEPAFKVFRKHPITRGMASYLMIWPTGNIIQQILSEQEKFDIWRIIRFGLYGALITAPSLFLWVRLSTSMYPNTNLRIACAKVRYLINLASWIWTVFAHLRQALIETISYTPIAMCIFFFSMTWLETFSAAEAYAEVKAKFLPTYCMAITIWPLIGVR